MLGVKRVSAGFDLSKKRVKKPSEEEYEEWSGFALTP